MENYKVYLVRLFNNNESFVKIGFTKDSIEKRMYPIFDYSFEEIGVIDSLMFDCCKETTLAELKEMRDGK